MATFINGRAYKQNELLDSGKYKVLRVGNFYTNDSWYYSNLELADKYYIDKGDLVYTWSATFGPHIWDGEKVIYHYHIWKIELSKFLDRNFTLQILEADKAKLLANTNGSTMIHVTKKDMESKVISLPIIEEQKQIGLYLTKFDTLIALYERKLKLLSQVKKYFLDNLFAEKEYPNLRFKGFTDAWEQRKLNDMSKVYDGIHETPQYTTKGIPFVSVENIKKLTTKKFVSKEFYEKKFKVKPEKNDIFITRIGDIGTSNVVSKSPLAYYVSLALVKINQDQNSYFFKYLFDSEYVQKEFWKRTLHIAFPKKINKNEIGKINIHITNTAEEDKIAQLFNKLESLLALYEDKQQHLIEIKNTLLNTMFI